MEIEAKNLSFEYDEGIKVLDCVSFSLEDGDSVGLVGPNGAGKSTLLRLMVGLEPGYEGLLSVDGLAVVKKNLNEIRRSAGYVFQDAESQLFNLTGEAEVAFGPTSYGLSESEVKERVDEALRLTDAEDLRHKKIYKMSGGEKRLISIACVLSSKPELLLMDEPSITLDPKNRRRLIELLKKLDCTKIVATHDLDLVWDVCEKTMVMSRGRIVAFGETKAILRDQRLLDENELELPLRFQGE